MADKRKHRQMTSAEQVRRSESHYGRDGGAHVAPATRTHDTGRGSRRGQRIATRADGAGSYAERIKKLLMYYSAKSPEGTRISLDDYVKAMPKDQKDIYFLTAERLEDARHSPQIEQALKHGCDVLFFVDPVDEWLVDDFREYEGKKLVDIAKGDVQFGSEADQKAEKEANEKASADLKPFLDAVKEQLKDNVSDVRVSTRLADSPCCLVAGANALSASMERMLRAMNQEVPHEKRLLEINAAHPLVEKMKGLTGDALKDAVELLYDQALIAEGSAIPDPGRFTKLLTQLMLKP